MAKVANQWPSCQLWSWQQPGREGGDHAQHSHGRQAVQIIAARYDNQFLIIVYLLNN